VSVRDRLAVVCHFRHLLAARAGDLAAAVAEAVGAPAVEVLAAEVLPLAAACRFLERQAARVLRPRRPGRAGRPLWLGGVRVEIRREPFGVILVIGPRNYPLLLPGVQALQALAAGNAVLLKPGEGTAPVAELVAELLYTAGLPRDLLHVLSDGADAGRAAIDAGVDKVVLTGSARTGAAVLRQLAPRMVPAVVELSGCDAAFVRHDADLDLTARALGFGLRLRDGRTCIAPRRVFVAREVAGELERRLAAVVRLLPQRTTGCPFPAEAAGLVRDALARGARLCAGRVPAADGALAPVVLADTPPDVPLLRADVLAPVLSLVPVGGDEEALALAARCPYALGATVFGAEAGTRALAGRVRAGVVLVNDVIVPTADPRLPFGGRGRSGFGLTRGAEGLLEMTAVKVVGVRRGRWRPHLEAPRPGDEALFRAYLRAVHGGTWLGRLRGWWALLRGLIRRGAK
jgi:acyl-CoA reductase-like NAD-dependent aldehyde dehydrogenase